MNNLFDGTVMDFRVYTAHVSDADIQLLASQIGRPTLATPELWWMLNEGTGTDAFNTGYCGGTASNCDGEIFDGGSLGATWLDSPFSIVAQGEDTGTGGDVDIIQGTLEGLGLTSLAFDNTDDYLNFTGFNPGNDFSGFAWVNPVDLDTGDDVIFGGPTNDRKQLDFNDAYQLRYHDNDLVNPSCTYDIDEADYNGVWTHVGVTRIGTTTTLFVNGAVVQTCTQTNSTDNDITYIGYTGSSSQYFNGSIRDVRIYDYTLSTDQAASLYAGSYLVTPLHNWKMDEGTGVNTVADTGSGTTLTATQNGCTSAPCPAWQNADLDLDGALYLHAETTLSAPRGSIEVAGKYTQYGTYTHHDGLFHLDGNVQETQWGAYTIGPFYDLQTSGTTTEIRSHMIVEHHLTLTSTCTLPSYTNAIWTMGTLTSPGKIIGTASNPVCVHDNLMDASPDYFTVKAADTTGTHLVEITGNNWDWSYVGTPQGIKFGSVDVQFDLNIQNDTSGGFGNTIVLIDDYSVFKTLTISGNAEFDPDTFDLKLGKGVGGNSRIIDCNGTFNPSGGNLTITGNTGDIRANWFQANPFDVTIDLTNPTDTLNADSSGGGAFQLQRDLIINKGIYNTDSTANHPITVGRHIILQNNGTLTPNSSTVTIATDFDSSAGTITNGDVGWHLVMTGTGTWTSASPNNHKVYDITVGTSGLRTVAGSPYIYGLLTVNSNGIGGGGGITIGLSGPTAPVMNGGATFVNIGQVIYQCGTTCYATGTDYNTIRISAGSDVILTGDIGDAHQVKLDGGTTFTTNGYDITTNIVNHTGDDIFITGGSDFKFEHSYVGNGFGSSYGDLNADGFAGAVFDGTNDYLNVPIDTTGFTSITWTTWVFHQQGTTGALIKSFQWDSGYHIGFHSAFKVYVATDIATQQECAGVGFLDDVWNFVGISVSPSEINIYVKNSGGETTTTCAITTGTGAYIPSTNPSVHLGSGSGWSGAYLDGYMADARVFDSALTSANITSIYGTGTHDENNPATNEGNVYTSYGSPEAWYRLNDGDDFNSGAAGGVVDSAGTNHGQAKNGTQSGEVLITSTSATPSNYWDFRTGMDVTANHATFEGYGMYANDGGGDNDVINSTFINLGGGEAVYFHGNGSVTRFSHNTITAAAAGLFAYSITVANLDNITINGVLSAYDVRADNAQIELTNSYFDETNVSNINGGDVVSINHNGATDYYVFATTLDYSDIINKVQTSHSNIHLYEGTWNLDENTNFQTATLTITSGTLKVTSENTWGTVTPANVNSYPVIEGAVLYWWNAVFNPLAIPRDVNAGLVKYNTGSYYDIYGVVTESTVNVGWSVNDVGILGEIPVRLIGTQGAHCSTYCQTKWVIDENVEMRNLTIYNNSKFDQVPNGAASVYSRYDPAYSGVYVQTGGLWSIVGTSAFNAYAERLSGLSAGIWNLTPQACNPSLLHIDLANIRHEFEPCGMIPYFAATLTDTWPGNDTIWWTSYKTATPSEIGAKFVSNGIQISTPERRNEDWTSLRVMILSNITQPQNLTADLWIKRGDNPATAFDECNKGPACVWTKISMTNHLNGDYTASFKFYWDGRYEFFIEANDTKNDITDHFFITYLKQKGPFEALYGMMPAWITVAVVGAFVPIITGLPRKYGV
jgi:hypothetical protein